MIDSINDILGYLLMVALAACGIWFTIRTKGFQFRMMKEMMRLLTDKPPVDDAGGESEKKGKRRQISSFQAFAVSVATRVGTGNLAGVATAIALGGPGAVFWMWVMALLGAATAFVEATLGQLYKRRNGDTFIGGPAYYITHGLHRKWMAYLFAVLISLTFGLSYNSIQSNTICSAMHEAFGWNTLTVGIVLASVSLFIVFGGIHRIARLSTMLVPVMAVGYFILVIVIMTMNITLIPSVFIVIISNAFGFGPAIGGAVGAAIIYGVKRGLFSNEAGAGSAPNVAATADVSHPVKQGLIQSLGVFTDTLLVCSCTAFIILISGIYEYTDINGIALVQTSLSSEIGAVGPIFIAIAILLFAFSSIVGNYYYGEVNIRFMTRSKTAMTIYRLFSAGIMVIFGAVASLDSVWTLGDICTALLTFCNLIAIIALGKYAFRLLEDYLDQKRNGVKNPTFCRSQLPDIQHELECWD